jgi:hypothetical protein
VVTGRRGNDAAFASTGRQGQDAVQRTADLVRARALEVLVLEPDAAAAQVRERARLPARRQVDAASQAGGSRLNVLEAQL